MGGMGLNDGSEPVRFLQGSPLTCPTASTTWRRFHPEPQTGIEPSAQAPLRPRAALLQSGKAKVDIRLCRSLVGAERIEGTRIAERTDDLVVYNARARPPPDHAPRHRADDRRDDSHAAEMVRGRTAVSPARRRPSISCSHRSSSRPGDSQLKKLRSCGGVTQRYSVFNSTSFPSTSFTRQFFPKSQK